MADISANGIETILGNDGILWLNGKHIKDGLDEKHLWEITIKYRSDHKKHRHKLQSWTKYLEQNREIQ